MDPFETLVAHLPGLLLLFWGLCSGAAVVALLPVQSLSRFRSAVLLSACRGKLMDVKPENALGPLSDWTVPQKWFAHFYAVGAAWNAAVLLLLLRTPFYASLPAAAQATHLLALGLLEGHLLRRLLETLGLLRYPAGARMHGVAYAYGLAYYLVVPITLLPEAGFLSVYRAATAVLGGGGSVPPAPALPSLPAALAALRPVQLLGVAAFLAGNALQLHSHALLARLAPGKGRGPKPAYRIPRGGAFAAVSCPHYLAEILVYVGLVALEAGGERGCRATLALLLAWVAANLALAAGLTHAWYRRTFKTYPRSRRALIPWLY